jgi:hypothetical protein
MQWALRDILEEALPRGALICDRSAAELFRHDLDDGGIRVQPFDEAVSGLAIGKAAVELLPDFERETG